MLGGGGSSRTEAKVTTRGGSVPRREEANGPLRSDPAYEPGRSPNEVWPLIERQQELPEREHRRLSLACQWYWRADAERIA